MTESQSPGYVYFVQQGESGPIKIGYSINPDRRIPELQTGSAWRLNLIGIHEGSQRVESGLHKRFSGYRMHGEWFMPCSELVEVATGVAVESTFDYDQHKLNIALALSGHDGSDQFKSIAASQLLDAFDKSAMIFCAMTAARHKQYVGLTDDQIRIMVSFGLGIDDDECPEIWGLVDSMIHGLGNNLARWAVTGEVASLAVGIIDLVPEFVKDREASAQIADAREALVVFAELAE